MNCYQLELCKIKLRSNLKNCKDDRLKISIKNDIELLEQKQMKLLQKKSLVKRIKFLDMITF